jgi:hypothetical protein
VEGSELSRPEVRDVVTVDIAEVELAAVRALLDQLRDDVHHEERAAAAAENQIVAPTTAPRAAPELDAIDVSRRIVEQMAAQRRGEIRTAEQQALIDAQAQVDEARQHAQNLAAAAHRDVAQVLRVRFPGVSGPAPAVDPDVELRHWEERENGAPPRALRLPDPPAWAEALPPLQHWAEPAPRRWSAVAPTPPVPEPDETTRAHEQFWREEAQVSAARSTGVAPVEVLLPTAALLLVLFAVLLLIG